jgi:hypothetical protein
MSKGAIFDTDFLKLILNGTGVANLADNAAGSPLTNLYLSLHNADPTAAGDQTSHETAYGSYARVAVPRTSGGFAVAAGVGTLVADAVFPAATSGADTITFAALGTASSGAGKLLWTGAVTPNIPVSTPVAPRLAAGSTVTET